MKNKYDVDVVFIIEIIITYTMIFIAFYAEYKLSCSIKEAEQGIAECWALLKSIK